MDNHPIPQDVSHFQFKLIGDMTIKQFAYLAVGIILAWLFLSLPIFFIIKFFLVVFFAGTGAILAFIPIEGRPADTMILYFIKALFSPNQYIYHKQAPDAGIISGAQTTHVTKEREDHPKDVAKPAHETVMLEALPAAFTTPVATPSVYNPQTKVAAPAPTQAPIPQVEQPQIEEKNLSSQAEVVAKEIALAKEAELKQAGAKAVEAHEKTLELEKELHQILSQKQDLEKQLISLQQQLAKKREQVFTPSQATDVPQTTQRVKKIPKTMTTNVGLPFAPDVPNLVMGIVKDPRGNVLPNILIEVKDKDGNPVRAFKTNPLGQFASATPLVSGLYTISFEDPKGANKFDAIEVDANGDVLLPFEVISEDAREELRKELFG